MNNLEKLKRKYEELGKEIERLEKEKSCKRWRAKEDQEYYYINNYLNSVSMDLEENKITDNYLYKTFNYFKTEEEAQRHLDNINTYYELMNLAEELNEGKKIDWNETSQKKFYICYDYYNEELSLCYHYNVKDTCQICCLSENFLKIALERIGEDRLENLFKEK